MKPILKDLKEYLASGGQCYVICPLVEDSEVLDAKSASQIAEAMQQYFHETYQVGLLHGQMKDDEKDRVMQDFQNKKIHILVSTTVVEVGVDVINANMMVIYNAERFGMSQLHQLRGRVGRGHQQAYCFLMSSSTSKEAIDLSLIHILLLMSKLVKLLLQLRIQILMVLILKLISIWHYVKKKLRHVYLVRLMH